MSAGQPGFWDVEDRLRELSAQGDPLEKLAATVDFELFRADLTASLASQLPAVRMLTFGERCSDAVAGAIGFSTQQSRPECRRPG
jgi:hypothetical protein